MAVDVVVSTNCCASLVTTVSGRIHLVIESGQPVRKFECDACCYPVDVLNRCL